MSAQVQPRYELRGAENPRVPASHRWIVKGGQHLDLEHVVVKLNKYQDRLHEIEQTNERLRAENELLQAQMHVLSTPELLSDVLSQFTHKQAMNAGETRA